MALAGALEVQLLAETARLRSDMEKARSIVETGAAHMERAAAGVKTALGALGLGVGIGGLMALFKSIVNGVDALNDLRDATGASIEKLSALEDIAKRNGNAFDVVGASLIKFNKYLSEAKPGSGPELILKAIGVSARELRDVDPADALMKTAIALNQFADDGNKARVVQELFGKSLKEVAPMLRDMAEAGKLQSTVTTQQAEEAERLNKQFFAMQTESAALKREIVTGLVPALSLLLQNFRGIKELGAMDLILKDAGKQVLSLGLATRRITGDNGADINRILTERAQKERELTQAEQDGRGMHIRTLKEDIFQLNRYLELLRLKQQNQILAANAMEYSDAVSRRVNSSKPSIGNLPDTTAIAAANKELDAQRKLLMELNGLSPSFLEEWDRIGRMYAKGTISMKEQEQMQAKLLAQQPFMKEQAKILEDEAKAAEQAAAARAKYFADLVGGLDKIQAETAAERESAARLGLSKEAILQLDAAKLDLLATNQELIASSTVEIDEAEVAIALRKAKAYRDLADAKRGTAATEAALETQKTEIDRFKSVFDSIDRTAHDVRTNIFDGGSNVFKKLGQTLKASLLDLLYQMTVRPWLLNIVANVTGSGGIAGAAAGVMGQGGGLGGMLGGLGGIFGSAGAYSAAVPGLAFGGQQAAMLAAQTGVFGAEGLAATAAAGGSSIAGALGAFMPYLGPIAVGAMLISSLLKGKGETRSGGQYVGTNLVGAPSGGQIGADGVAQSISATISTIDSTLKALGSNLTASYFVSGLESSKNGMGFAYAGGSLSNGTIFGQGVNGLGYMNNRGSMTPEEAAASFQKELEQATLQAIQTATDIPEAVAKQLRGVDIDSITDEARKALLASINATILSVQQFGAAMELLPFAGLKGLAFDAASALIAANGGVEKFTANLNSFYENFIPNEEKRQNVADQIAKVLVAAGQQVSGSDVLKLAGTDDARARFREIVQSTEQGSPLWNALIAVNTAFSSLVPAAIDATSAISDVMKSLQSDTNNLRVEMLNAQGNTRGAQALQRALDIAGFSQAEIALYDYNQGIRDQIALLNASKAAQQSWYDNFTSQEQKRRDIATNIAGSVNGSGLGLNVTVDQILGGTREQVAEYMRQFQAMGAAGQPFVDLLLSLGDAFASITPATESAADAINSVMANLIAEGRRLQVQLLQVRGDSAGASALQRAIDTEGWTAAEIAIYDANRALHAQIDTEQRLADDVTKARGVLVSAYQREASALESTISRMRDFARGVREFKDSLLLNDQLSPLNPAAKYNEALRQYQETVAAARAGDVGAQSRVQEVSTAFLQASRDFFGSSDRYTQDFNAVQAALKLVANSASAQADVQQLQLDYLQSQLAVLGSLDSTAVSIADALASYQEAILAAIAAGQNPDTTGSGLPGGFTTTTPTAPYLGPPVMNPVASIAMNSNSELLARIDALTAEVALLREQNNEGHAINAQATMASGEQVGATVEKTASMSARKSELRPAIA